MFCGECGKLIDEDAKFCGECGARADATIAAPSRPAAQTVPDKQVPPKPARRARSQQGWFFLGGIFGVICVRLFFLDAMEDLGWRIFWEELANGRILEPGMVVRSTTFLKSVIGFFVAGFLVWAVRVAIEPNSQ